MDLAAIKKAAEGATKGPWKFIIDPAGHFGVYPPNGKFFGIVDTRANAEYMTACDPATILALVVVAEAAQAFLDATNRDMEEEREHEWSERFDKTEADLKAALAVIKTTDRGRGGR